MLIYFKIDHYSFEKLIPVGFSRAESPLKFLFSTVVKLRCHLTREIDLHFEKEEKVNQWLISLILRTLLFHSPVFWKKITLQLKSVEIVFMFLMLFISLIRLDLKISALSMNISSFSWQHWSSSGVVLDFLLSFIHIYLYCLFLIIDAVGSFDWWGSYWICLIC